MQQDLHGYPPVDPPRSRPLALLGWLPAWDLERRSVDPTAVIEWTLAQLRQWGEDIETLSEIECDGVRARTLAERLTQASLSPALRRPLHRALEDAIPTLPWDEVWVQTFAHFRILVPGDPVAPVPPHTDFGFGHGLEERNLWLPLTDADGPSALHVLDLDASLSWMMRTGKVEGPLHAIDTLRPVPMNRGELLLFTPLHIHGAHMPRQGARVSVDLRFTPRPRADADFTFCPLWGRS